jgi:single-stranded-DNA-specific exonuclease
MARPVRIVDRPVSSAVRTAAIAAGYSPLQTRVIAGRLGDEHAVNLAALLQPRLGGLTSPDRLPDIDKAADAVARAIVDGTPLITISDFDCDGASGHSVLRIALRDYFGVPESQIHSFIGHRLREGYGVTESLSDRIIAHGLSPALAITVDHGSTDHDRIAKLRSNGILTVVTDHHGVPDSGPPPEALACVNPVRTDSEFPDPYIAGVHVAWLLCCAVRQRLVDVGHLPGSAPKLGSLLDLVALGTMADCVDLARSPNNRMVLSRGLELMNAPGARPAWRALYAATRCSGPITASTIGFHFGPVINAGGRLDCALGSVDLLMSQDEAEALHMATALVEHNAQRKIVQAQMLRRAMPMAERRVAQGDAAITLLDIEGHPGVHGICAARLVEAFGCPVAYFSPKADSELASASLRTVPGFHVRNALKEIAALHPDDFIAWGGHAGAGGVTLKREAIERFANCFSAIAARELSTREKGPEILTDGELMCVPSLEVFAEISALEPFGRQWESPVFRGNGQIRKLQAMGDGSHLRLDIELDGCLYEAVWFGAVRDGVCPVEVGQYVRMAYELDANSYRNRTRLQLRIRHALPVD